MTSRGALLLALLWGCLPSPAPSEAEPVKTSPVDSWLSAVGAALARGQLPLPDRGLDTDQLRAVLDSPRVSALRQLSLAGNRLDASAGRLLGEHPKLSGMERLILAQNPLGDAGLSALAAGPNARSLQELDVSGVGAAGPGVAALAAQARTLKNLNISYQPLDDTAASVVAGLPDLRILTAERAGLSAAAARALVLSGAQNLSLRDNTLPAGVFEGLEALGPRLEVLDLTGTGLGPRDVVALAQAEAPTLIALDLSGCPVGEAGAGALLTSPLLYQLKALSLARTDIPVASRAALRAAWGSRPGLTLPLP